MASTYAITGIQEGRGPGQQVPLRQEVDAWFADPANKTQVNLFFLALEHFQKIPVPEKLSYFQVAGIHGVPLVPWDEETESKVPLKEQLGYCTHNSVLFPNWHRPYMLLFEQRLHEIMIEKIIPTFPASLQPELIAAANKWRLPYWDWAAKKEDPSGETADYNVPVIVRPSIVSFGIGDRIFQIQNPMHMFSTAPKKMGDPSFGKFAIPAVNDGDDVIRFDECTTTTRCPPPNGLTLGEQNDDQVVKNIRDHHWYENKSRKVPINDDVGEAVHRLYSEKYFSSYDTFATTLYAKSTGTEADYFSLEDIHNNIHNWVGGDGHMASIPVSAFDPIFWIHHANIDRQLAIWQELNWDLWFDDSSQQLKDPEGNWSTPKYTPGSPEWPLAPFHADAKGTYFTSNSTREWLPFGYTYPELQPWLPENLVDGKFSKDKYHENIHKKINKLYHSTRDLVLTSRPDILRGGPPQEINTDTPSEGHPDYLVNVVYERFALRGLPYTIWIVLDDDPVGSIYNFSTPSASTGNSADGCENCRNQEAAAVLCKGQVQITSSLLRRAKDPENHHLSSLERDKVEEYLKEKLRWAVTTTGGTFVPPDRLPTLRVSLAAGQGIQYRDATKRSRYSDYEVVHSEIPGLPALPTI